MRLPVTVSNGPVTDEQAGWGGKKVPGEGLRRDLRHGYGLLGITAAFGGLLSLLWFPSRHSADISAKESRQRGSTLGVDPFYSCLTLVLVIDSSNIAPPCTSPACVSIVCQSARRRSICFMSGDL